MFYVLEHINFQHLFRRLSLPDQHLRQLFHISNGFSYVLHSIVKLNFFVRPPLCFAVNLYKTCYWLLTRGWKRIYQKDKLLNHLTDCIELTLIILWTPPSRVLYIHQLLCFAKDCNQKPCDFHTFQLFVNISNQFILRESHQLKVFIFPWRHLLHKK